jgi:hypothetical protein
VSTEPIFFDLGPLWYCWTMHDEHRSALGVFIRHPMRCLGYLIAEQV